MDKETPQENGSKGGVPIPPSSIKNNDIHNGATEEGLQAESSAFGERGEVVDKGRPNSEVGESSTPVEILSAQEQSAVHADGSKVSNQGIEPEGKVESTSNVEKPDADDDKSDIESIDGLTLELIDAIQYPEDLEPLKDRIEKAPKRVLQHLSYTRLMEDRMADLERRLAVVEDKEPDMESDPVASKATPLPELIMGLNRINWQEYKPKETKTETKKDLRLPVEHRRRHDFPGQSRYIIDVVVSEAWASELQSKGENYERLSSPLNPTEAVAHLTHASAFKDVPQPERIRINSTLLLQVLEKITGQQFSKSVVNDDVELVSQVFLRPFKLFVIYEKDIRDFVIRLQKISNVPELSQAPHKAREGEGVDANGKPPNTVHAETQSLLPKPQSPTGADKVMDLDPLETKRCLEELLVLVKLLDTDLKPTFDLRRCIENSACGEIAFQDLWHLFRLGEVIQLADTADFQQTYRILDVCGGKPFLCNRGEVAGLEPIDGRDVPKFSVLCFFYATDGTDGGAVQESFSIKWYDGAKAITSLPIYPIAFSRITNEISARQYLIDRGRRTMHLAQKTGMAQHKSYDGLTLAVSPEIREEVDSEVIIDLSLYSKKFGERIRFGATTQLVPDPRETQEYLDTRCLEEGCCQNTPIHKDRRLDFQKSAELLKDKFFMRDFFDLETELLDQDLLLCQCWVRGFVLRSRKWVDLDVTLVKDLQERPDGFNSLVLPEGHKETLLALVETHSKSKKLYNGLRQEDKQVDLVRGKGKGLIILLHGEPGVGKSSTAECVAEYTRRPLFQVTCGDIGETADEVEARLGNHFQLAHKWGCVLLLDEADVFLEARSRNDLKRNAIVSVFLRVLEYYSGILFLTTNRVGAFDQAFRSRIHMSLYYPKIQQDSTLKIWEMNLERAKEIWRDSLSIHDEDSKEILIFAEDHYKQLAELKGTWNGRQIRNAFQTAIALAEWDAHKIRMEYEGSGPIKPRLKKEHFRRVAEASKHFDQYVKETVGTETDVARERFERRDDLGHGDIDIQIAEQKLHAKSPRTPRGSSRRV